MHSLDELLNICEREIHAIKFAEEPRLLYQPIEYTLEAGGKRLRPVITLMCAEMFGGNIESALPAAMAVEVFHNFTLLHDDIMDKAPTRRFRPTVHQKWNENVAILSGDAMVITSYCLLAKSPKEHLDSLLDSFNDLGIGVCEGQLYDMRFEEQKDVSTEEYIKMITLKTSVMIAGAAKMGAIIGGATEAQCNEIYNFAVNIGIAFQIQDDLLDTYGNSESFGKEIGGDIMEGKKTYLLINAYQKATKEERAELQNILSTPMERSKKLESVKAIYNKLAICECADRAIEQYYQKAIAILSDIKLSKERKAPLIELSEMLIKRIR